MIHQPFPNRVQKNIPCDIQQVLFFSEDMLMKTGLPQLGPSFSLKEKTTLLLEGGNAFL